MTGRPPAESRYLDLLPAVFRERAEGDEAGFLGAFLRAFEGVLSGTGDAERPGLAERINGIAPDARGVRPLAGLARYATPGKDLPKGERAPAEFLEWLAGWVALSLRADLDEETQRAFIGQAATLYRSRGTAKGLADVLNLYAPGATVEEGLSGFQIRDAGRTAVLGVDTRLGGFAPHYFEVTLRRPRVPTALAGDPAEGARPEGRGAPSLPEELARYRAIAAEIIEAEKPAHCFYTLKIISASFRVGITSRLGVDTLLADQHA